MPEGLNSWFKVDSAEDRSPRRSFDALEAAAVQCGLLDFCTGMDSSARTQSVLAYSYRGWPMASVARAAIGKEQTSGQTGGTTGQDKNIMLPLQAMLRLKTTT